MQYILFIRNTYLQYYYYYTMYIILNLQNSDYAETQNIFLVTYKAIIYFVL